MAPAMEILMKALSYLLALALSVPAILCAQKSHESGLPITTSGQSQIFYDASGSGSLFLGVVVSGAPTSYTLNVLGCMKNVSTCVPLTSYTGTGSIALGPLPGGWDFVKATPNWTGGSNVSITINKTGLPASLTAAASPSSSVSTISSTKAPILDTCSSTLTIPFPSVGTDYHVVTTTGNCTITFGAGTSQQAAELRVKVLATTNTVTFSSTNVSWSGGTVPTGPTSTQDSVFHLTSFGSGNAAGND